jgi:hypothetical protein
MSPPLLEYGPFSVWVIMSLWHLSLALLKGSKIFQQTSTSPVDIRGPHARDFEEIIANLCNSGRGHPKSFTQEYDSDNTEARSKQACRLESGSQLLYGREEIAVADGMLEEAAVKGREGSSTEHGPHRQR